MADSAQLSMAVYSVEVTPQSAPVVVAMGIVFYGFSLVELGVDMMLLRERQLQLKKDERKEEDMKRKGDKIKNEGEEMELNSFTDVHEMRCCGPV